MANRKIRMKFLIIIPVHNEEKNIFYCLKSLEQQDFQNFEIVIVNDGSTDKTSEQIDYFLASSTIADKIKVVDLESSTHQPGAKIIRAFYAGLHSLYWQDFDIICKFDSDIIFPPHYLSEIHNIYHQNHRAGMVSGLVKITKKNIDYSQIYSFKNLNKEWIFENISSKKHIRGPIKSYRKECFQNINGLKPVLGWDNIDVLLAKKHLWETIAIPHLWVKHLRPTAYQYKKQKAEKLGEYFYNLGLNFPLATISALKASWKSRNFSIFFYILKSFLKQNHKLELTKEEISFIKKTKIKDIFNKFRIK